MQYHNVIMAAVLSGVGLICATWFFIFVILQAGAPKKLQELLKPKDWRRVLTQRKEFSVVGYCLIVSQFIGGVWVFSSIIYSTLVWSGLVSLREAITVGFLVYMAFWAIWENLDRAKKMMQPSPAQSTQPSKLAQAGDRIRAKLKASGFTETEAKRSPTMQLQVTFVPARPLPELKQSASTDERHKAMKNHAGVKDEQGLPIDGMDDGIS